MSKYHLLLIVAMTIISLAQILLKLGAQQQRLNHGPIFFSPLVLGGYSLLLVAMLLNIAGLSQVALRDMAFIMPVTFILTPLFAWLLLKEPLDRYYFIGVLIITIGIFVFNLPIL